MPEIRSVCVYCGSSSRGPSSHHDAARRLGTLLAENGVRLIFGGGQVGLMGVIADAALAAGGEVIGVIPAFLQDRELGHSGCDELIITDSMLSRKKKMAELSDGFAVLPGGLGTLDEAFEIITWKQLGLHDKPIVVVDIEGYWQPLSVMVERLTANNYMHPEHTSLFEFASSTDAILPMLREWQAPSRKIDSEKV